MFSKHSWSLQMLDLTGLGIGYSGRNDIIYCHLLFVTLFFIYNFIFYLLNVLLHYLICLTVILYVSGNACNN